MTRIRFIVTRLFALTCLSFAGLLLIAARPALAQIDCKPAAPLPASKCNKDAQCCAGLVCGPAGTSINNATAQCQPGCRIAGIFRSPGAINPANACQSCQPAVSTTAWTNVANGTTCNDGNACTQTDTCQSGVCVGANPVECTAADQCHVAGTCNPATGTCSNPNANDGTHCNDGNACTQTDTCQSGTCTGSNAVVCTASDQCHVPGTCNPSTGACSNPNANDGTPCNDGNACTQTDTCQAGVCTGSNPVTCTASDPCHVAGTCDRATGTCSNPNALAGTHCTGNSQTGKCEDNANDHCDGNGTCVDAFRPSSYVCDPDTGPNGEYLCRDVLHCSGTTSLCPNEDPRIILIRSWDPQRVCRPSTGSCDPPEYCASLGVCSPNNVSPAKHCDGGPRDGLYCDADNACWSPTDQTFKCVDTVCPGATLPCEKPWTCDGAGTCHSNGQLAPGTDCIGDIACEKYSCDATGDCVDQNRTRSATARCRPAANECDVPEACGDASTNSNYPNCGADVKKPWGTPCTYHPLGNNAPGLCIDGECNPHYCKNSIECPDGWVCGCPAGQSCTTPYCVPAPAGGGYGAVCAVKGYCSLNPLSWAPGSTCTSDADCSDVNHQGICYQSYCDNNSNRPGVGCASDLICQVNNHPAGKCVTDTRGDCGSIPGRTLDYVCCAGMAGDGLGGTPALGQTGRCQECCGNGGLPDQNCFDQTDPNGTTSFQCCDGKCTDVLSDIHNCVSCNYDSSGYDCTNLINACSPGVVKCDALNIGNGCVMEDHCAATAQQNNWTAASCSIPVVQVPVPSCDYCTLPSTTPGKPCLTDEECGGFPGTCYHDPSLFCFADRQQAYTTAPECLAAPFSRCAPTCCQLFDHAPNVGSDCSKNGDADCFGETKCISSCNLTPTVIGWYTSGFCFSNPTCQFLGGVQPTTQCLTVSYP